MPSRATKSSVKSFHVVVLSGSDIVGEELVQGVGEKCAFRRAEELVTTATGADVPSDITAYVLDCEQAFVASVTSPASRYRDGA